MADTQSPEIPEFIPKSGACLVTNTILSGEGRLKWCVREESARPEDNGWRFFSHIDTDEYLADPSNFTVISFNHAISIEPAVMGLYDLPVGTDVQLVVDEKGRRFMDNETGDVVIGPSSDGDSPEDIHQD